MCAKCKPTLFVIRSSWLAVGTVLVSWAAVKKLSAEQLLTISSYPTYPRLMASRLLGIISFCGIRSLRYFLSGIPAVCLPAVTSSCEQCHLQGNNVYVRHTEALRKSMLAFLIASLQIAVSTATYTWGTCLWMLAASGKRCPARQIECQQLCCKIVKVCTAVCLDLTHRIPTEQQIKMVMRINLLNDIIWQGRTCQQNQFKYNTFPPRCVNWRLIARLLDD